MARWRSAPDNESHPNNRIVETRDSGVASGDAWRRRGGRALCLGINRKASDDELLEITRRRRGAEWVPHEPASGMCACGVVGVCRNVELCAYECGERALTIQYTCGCVWHGGEVGGATVEVP